MDAAADRPTPPLREDLKLSETSPGHDGSPAWVIEDAVLNRFYRIGWFEFECLLRWGQPPGRICEQIAAETALQPDVDQVVGFGRFLASNQLVHPDAQATARLRSQSEGNPWLHGRWWLHHYLFFRIPLLRPQAVLQRLSAALDPVWRPATAWLVAALGLLGVILVLQQWDTFAAAVVESFSAEGLVSFAAALLVAKTLHELGHALVATRLGLRVAHMGVAFVVLWPMLYTDTGESWKLRSARQRLAVASAGILAELGLAGLATLGWALCDDGPLRNALLYLATTSWVLSLALNASPFMRFDGYFITSDLLDFPNLHERSSALARTALRRSLLGLDEPWPEAQPTGRRRALVAFAVTTWLYRLVLFAGIAVAVYLLFFKVLGIVLFVVEVLWFIVRPVWRELGHWWAARRAVPGSRRLAAGLLGLAALAFLAVPWRTQVDAVGVARSQQQTRVYAPFPGRLSDVRPAGDVTAGDTLVVLEDPDIDSRMRGNEAGQQGYEARLAGLIADPAGSAELAATRQRLIVEVEEVRAARTEMARLQLRAPATGRWLDVDPERQPGQWVGTRDLLGVLIDPTRWQVDAYVRQDEVHRLRPGDAVSFHAEGVATPLAGRVVSIGSTRVSELGHPMLATRFGGPLPVVARGESLQPDPPRFHVLVQLDTAPPGQRETRGRLRIDGAPRSLLGDGMTRLGAVLLRESGF
ncbi:HlyD family efflux transporter periplasmic adaptor subunit [Piscinibacter gummiphilus]|uniref:Peptidase M50 n=1 Tax=Piscinibacter gummiphilus TaxID=946333 RepID=A0A1W6LBQ6_9BURK|nr:HlyD family efflux transporter periplasmic adaptor subunit [Piscinibacter gummiphilus]ARN21699.1 peptidase M50 [Piscinibacter gummiphilus]ATU66387.1 peptidase M50 [Piscinibacter gummiphilus]GLS95731.1 peptidase M50 [Piscinibacter gummiphilus]